MVTLVVVGESLLVIEAKVRRMRLVLLWSIVFKCRKNLGMLPSAVGFSSRLQLHGPGSKTDLPHPSRPTSEPTQFTVQLVQGVKSPGRVVHPQKLLNSRLQNK